MSNFLITCSGSGLQKELQYAGFQALQLIISLCTLSSSSGSTLVLCTAQLWHSFSRVQLLCCSGAVVFLLQFHFHILLTKSSALVVYHAPVRFPPNRLPLSLHHLHRHRHLHHRHHRHHRRRHPPLAWYNQPLTWTLAFYFQSSSQPFCLLTSV